MKLRAFILTCPARAETVCAETLRVFAGTDWPAPLEVFLNESDAPQRHERITAGMLRLLRRGLEDSGADYLLICEDDTRFNLHLHHNLAAWPRSGAAPSPWTASTIPAPPAAPPPSRATPPSSSNPNWPSAPRPASSPAPAPRTS